MGREVFRASDQDGIRWRADAARAGMNYSEWIRFCLNRMSGRDLNAVLGKPSPKARQPEAVEVNAGAVERHAGVGREAPPSQLPPRALESPTGGFVRMRETARDLAGRTGKCTADVARGTRCKLCGKIH